MNPLSSWSDLHARLHKTLHQRQLIPLGSRFLIAVSGGQDSLCLTKLLFDLKSKWQWQMAIAHCDHCWSSFN
jgi:tRNA(Ile)-lysidine synthase